MTTPVEPPSSAKDARARARAERAYRKAQRPWLLRHWFLSGVGALIVVIVIAVIASSGSGTGTSNAGHTSSGGGGETNGKVLQHPEDVTIVSCAKDQAGFADAKVKITNHSGKASDYVVTIAFESPGGSTQIGTGTAVVDSLQPGQSTTQDANSLETPHRKFICKVSDAQRTSSM